MKVTKYVHARSLEGAQTAANMGFLYSSAEEAGKYNPLLNVYEVTVEIECVEVRSVATK